MRLRLGWSQGTGISTDWATLTGKFCSNEPVATSERWTIKNCEMRTNKLKNAKINLIVFLILKWRTTNSRAKSWLDGDDVLCFTVMNNMKQHSQPFSLTNMMYSLVKRIFKWEKLGTTWLYWIGNWLDCKKQALHQIGDRPECEFAVIVWWLFPSWNTTGSRFWTGFLIETWISLYP